MNPIPFLPGKKTVIYLPNGEQHPKIPRIRFDGVGRQRSLHTKMVQIGIDPSRELHAKIVAGNANAGQKPAWDGNVTQTVVSVGRDAAAVAPFTPTS